MAEKPLSKQAIASMIDHAILKPDTTLSVLHKELRLAHELSVFSVCVRPADISETIGLFSSLASKTKVGTVISFPHGSDQNELKVAEISTAAELGVNEVDIVINIGKLKDSVNNVDIADALWNELSEQDDIAKLNGVEKTKLILETAYLTPQEIAFGSKLGVDAGFDFIKTSTGFAPTGATLENLKIMKEAVDGKAELKASGGVGDLESLLSMYRIGVTRFGTSKSKIILAQYDGNEIEDSEPNEY